MDGGREAIPGFCFMGATWPLLLLPCCPFRLLTCFTTPLADPFVLPPDGSRTLGFPFGWGRGVIPFCFSAPVPWGLLPGVECLLALVLDGV